MPAYMMIACKITDREKFKDGYGKEAAGLVAKMGGKYLALCPTGTLLEGTREGYTSCALSEWPDRETAQAFWDLPEYAEIKKLREGIAEVEVFLVDGLE